MRLCLVTVAAALLSKASAQDLDTCPPITVELQPAYYSEVIPFTTVVDPFRNGHRVAVTQAPSTVIALTTLSRTIWPTAYITLVTTLSRTSSANVRSMTTSILGTREESSVAGSTGRSSTNSHTTTPSVGFSVTSTASGDLQTSSSAASQQSSPSLIRPPSSSVSTIVGTSSIAPDGSTTSSGPPVFETLAFGLGIPVPDDPEDEMIDLPEELFLVLAISVNIDVDIEDRGYKAMLARDGLGSTIDMVNLGNVSMANTHNQDSCDSAIPLSLRNGRLVHYNESIAKPEFARVAPFSKFEQSPDMVDTEFSLKAGMLQWRATDLDLSGTVYSCPNGIYAVFEEIPEDESCLPLAIGAIAGHMCQQRVERTREVEVVFQVPTGIPPVVSPEPTSTDELTTTTTEDFVVTTSAELTTTTTATEQSASSVASQESITSAMTTSVFDSTEPMPTEGSTGSVDVSESTSSSSTIEIPTTSTVELTSSSSSHNSTLSGIASEIGSTVMEPTSTDQLLTTSIISDGFTTTAFTSSAQDLTSSTPSFNPESTTRTPGSAAGTTNAALISVHSSRTVESSGTYLIPSTQVSTNSSSGGPSSSTNVYTTESSLSTSSLLSTSLKPSNSSTGATITSTSSAISSQQTSSNLPTSSLSSQTSVTTPTSSTSTPAVSQTPVTTSTSSTRTSTVTTKTSSSDVVPTSTSSSSSALYTLSSSVSHPEIDLSSELSRTFTVLANTTGSISLPYSLSASTTTTVYSTSSQSSTSTTSSDQSGQETSTTVVAISEVSTVTFENRTHTSEAIETTGTTGTLPTTLFSNISTVPPPETLNPPTASSSPSSSPSDLSIATSAVEESSSSTSLHSTSSTAMTFTNTSSTVGTTPGGVSTSSMDTTGSMVGTSTDGETTTESSMSSASTDTTHINTELSTPISHTNVDNTTSTTSSNLVPETSTSSERLTTSESMTTSNASTSAEITSTSSTTTGAPTTTASSSLADAASSSSSTTTAVDETTSTTSQTTSRTSTEEVTSTTTEHENTMSTTASASSTSLSSASTSTTSATATVTATAIIQSPRGDAAQSCDGRSYIITSGGVTYDVCPGLQRSGHNFRNLNTDFGVDLQECAEACTDADDCYEFEYTPLDDTPDGTCLLKGLNPADSDDLGYASPIHISGLRINSQRMGSIPLPDVCSNTATRTVDNTTNRRSFVVCPETDLGASPYLSQTMGPLDNTQAVCMESCAVSDLCFWWVWTDPNLSGGPAWCYHFMVPELQSAPGTMMGLVRTSLNDTSEVTTTTSITTQSTSESTTMPPTSQLTTTSPTVQLTSTSSTSTVASTTSTVPAPPAETCTDGDEIEADVDDNAIKFSLTCETRRPGLNLGISSNNGTRQECAEACANNIECFGFEYAPSVDVDGDMLSSCTLKGASPLTVVSFREEGLRMYGRTLPDPPLCADQEMRFYSGVRFLYCNNRMRTVSDYNQYFGVVNIEHCAELCADDMECLYWNYQSLPFPRCRVKYLPDAEMDPAYTFGKLQDEQIPD